MESKLKQGLKPLIAQRQKLGVCILAAVLTLFNQPAFSDTSKKHVTIASQILNGDHRAQINRSLEAFSQLHENITVELISFRDSSNYASQVEQWLEQGHGPNVFFWYGGERITALSEKKQLHKLDDIWQEQKLDKLFPKAVLDSVQRNSSRYAIPITFYLWAMYYRQQKMKNLNITPPSTWDEVLQNCKELRSQGIDLFSLGTKSDIWVMYPWFDYLLLRVGGIAFYKELTSGKISYYDPRVKQALSHLQTLVEGDCFNHNTDAYSLWQAFPRVLHGFSAMSLIEGLPQRHLPSRIHNDVRVAPFPEVEKGHAQYVVGMVNVFVVPSYTQLTPELEKLLIFLTSDNFQTTFNLPIGRLPARASSIKKFPPLVQDMAAIVDKAPGSTLTFDRETNINFSKHVPKILVDFLTHKNIQTSTEQLEHWRQRIYSTPQERSPNEERNTEQ
ncbi:ABC transporter substrate-binding protein [Agaribacterium sp. ZY112]|uniref:ABC transporter substrate-binding protein n=1 Tax=Agaribacterium sp. ZY112 TaxID=3233574 RepID=UPI00352640F5